MTQYLESEFGALRSYFWPIHRSEVRKIVPMLLMLFLICFNYSLLKNMKDSVVITTSGAEVIPFIKVWAMLPMAVLLTYLFTKLTNRYSQEKVFYIMTTAFLLFFALYAFVLYPLRESVHPHETADWLAKKLPLNFKWLVSMFRYWSFISFYVIAELWGSMILTVLFWGFANEVTKIHEAGRFYSVFAIAANFSAILAGLVGNYLARDESYGNSAWEVTQMMLMGVIIVSGIMTMGLFRWMNQTVLSNPDFEELHKASHPKKKKQKLSLRESFSYLSNSRYLILIAIMVVSYNLVINLVEVIWKDKLRLLCPSPSDYNTYMNNLTAAMGIVSTLTSFFIAKIIFRYGWTKIALITPVILLVTSSGFFSFLFFQGSLDEVVLMLTGTTPLVLAVFFGAAQNCLSKAAKYSVFDATKEMAFIPLNHDVKLKGKAAIDGVGSRLGKSGGSLIHQGLFILFGSLTVSMPYVAVLLMIVIVFWIIATRKLGKLFAEKATEQDPESVEIFSPHQEDIQPEAVLS